MTGHDRPRFAPQPRPRLVLLCGLPGSGKSTLARRLAVELPAMVLTPDDWMSDLGVDLFDEGFRDLLEERFWLHAQELLGLGVNVVLESGFWLRSDRDSKRVGGQALGASVEIHVLTHDVEELWRRLERRNAALAPGFVAITRELLELHVTMFEAPGDDELALFDLVERMTGIEPA